LWSCDQPSPMADGTSGMASNGLKTAAIPSPCRLFRASRERRPSGPPRRPPPMRERPSCIRSDRRSRRQPARSARPRGSIAGYLLNLFAVPLLALAGAWQCVIRRRLPNASFFTLPKRKGLPHLSGSRPRDRRFHVERRFSDDPGTHGGAAPIKSLTQDATAEVRLYHGNATDSKIRGKKSGGLAPNQVDRDRISLWWNIQGGKIRSNGPGIRGMSIEAGGRSGCARRAAAGALGLDGG
jgi:hypothetical protein